VIRYPCDFGDASSDKKADIKNWMEHDFEQILQWATNKQKLGRIKSCALRKRFGPDVNKPVVLKSLSVML
jgi:hypothetical protein